MKVLITGSSGFIGSAIVNCLKRSGITSIGIDLNKPRAGAEPHEFHKVNICEANKLLNVINNSRAQLLYTWPLFMT